MAPLLANLHPTLNIINNLSYEKRYRRSGRDDVKDARRAETVTRMAESRLWSTSHIPSRAVASIRESGRSSAYPPIPG